MFGFLSVRKVTSTHKSYYSTVGITIKGRNQTSLLKNEIDRVRHLKDSYYVTIILLYLLNPIYLSIRVTA